MIVPKKVQTVESVGKHYDDLDSHYRQLWGEHVHHGFWETGKETPEVATEKLIQKIVELSEFSSGDSLCDVGCGYGGTSRWLTNNFQAKTTGFTVSQAQYNFASEQTKGSEYPKYFLRNWLENEMPSDSFDGLISIECLAHVPEKQKYFEEIYRVLKPGSTAVIAAWMTCDKPGRFSTNWLLEPICREGRLPSMGSPTEYTEMIEKAGLKLLEYEDVSKQVRKTWSILGRRMVWGVLTDSKIRKEIWNREHSNVIFAVTLFRILAAYYNGSMVYGLFSMRKPA